MNSLERRDNDPVILGSERPFPIQGGESTRALIGGVRYAKPSTIPWWLAEEAYRYYSKRFGTSQSLERLAERGGFGRKELLALLRQEDL